MNQGQLLFTLGLDPVSPLAADGVWFVYDGGEASGPAYEFP